MAGDHGRTLRTVGLAALAVLAMARGAAAGGAACEEGRAAAGLAVGPQEGALAVVAVDDGSPAARAGFRVGDVVLQANDALPATCSQWGRAVTGARDGARALLVLVRRGDAEIPLALVAATWAPAGAPAVAGGEPGKPAPTPVPKVAAPPPPPPPLADDVAVSVAGVLDGLGTLTPPEDQPPTDLGAYRAQVVQVRREIETLKARNAAPEAVVAQLRGAARYYEAAVVAWQAMEQRDEIDRRSRRMPVADGMTVDYFEDSPAAQILDEFPFLEATIAKEPKSTGIGIESAGRWRPGWARTLLWERGARAVAELRGESPS